MKHVIMCLKEAASQVAVGLPDYDDVKAHLVPNEEKAVGELAKYLLKEGRNLIYEGIATPVILLRGNILYEFPEIKEAVVFLSAASKTASTGSEPRPPA